MWQTGVKTALLTKESDAFTGGTFDAISTPDEFWDWFEDGPS